MKIFKYVVVGGIQFVLDLCLFMALKYCGLSVVFSNTASRLLAAILGFYLNKNFTFSISGRASWYMLAKYWLFWGGMTVLSTALIHVSDLAAGKYLPLAVIKFCVEAFLCFVGFLISRFWVYRHARE